MLVSLIVYNVILPVIKVTLFVITISLIVYLCDHVSFGTSYNITRVGCEVIIIEIQGSEFYPNSDKIKTRRVGIVFIFISQWQKRYLKLSQPVVCGEITFTTSNKGQYMNK